MAFVYAGLNGYLPDELFEPITLDLSPLHDVVRPIAKSAGHDLTSMWFLLLIFGCYPVAIINSLLPRGILRHLLMATTGILAMQIMFGSSWGFLALMAGVTYGCLLPVQLGLAKGSMARLCCWLCVFLTFDIMFARHVQRVGGQATGIDVCAGLMVMFLKLSGLALSVMDGSADLRYLLSQAEAERIEVPDKSDTKLLRKSLKLESARRTALWRLHRAVHLPNPLQFLGYAFSPLTSLAGPAFEYSQYIWGTDGLRSLVEGKGKDAKLTLAPDALWEAGLKQHPRWYRSLYSLGFGLVMLAGYAVAGPSFGIADMLGEEWGAMSWAVYVLHFFVAQIVMRMMYYFSWLVAEGAAVAGGFGYMGPHVDGKAATAEQVQDAQPKLSDHMQAWHGACNVHPVQIETSQSLEKCIKEWNMHTQSWLNFNVNKRAHHLPIDPKLTTFVVSALWHGVYPGYLVSFLFVFVATTTFTVFLREFGSTVDAIVTVLGPVGSVLRWFFVISFLNFSMAPFIMLEMEKGFVLWERLGYWGIWLIAALLLLGLLAHFAGLGDSHRKRVEEAKKKKGD